jgi:exodeoxyribonuclease-3
VAILSKQSPDEVNRGLPGDDSDEQARFIEAVFSTDGGVLRVVSLYLPNGNPVDTEKFPYKLRWMERLQAFAEDRLALEEPLVLAGDYNVIPEPVDCHDPKVWEGDALFRPESRTAFRRLENLGFTDALRAVNDQAQTYTFWDYQAGAWPKNNGIRIDHLMLSPEAADRLQSANVEKHVRGWEKPSDHVPVAISLGPLRRPGRSLPQPLSNQAALGKLAKCAETGALCRHETARITISASASALLPRWSLPRHRPRPAGL